MSISFLNLLTIDPRIATSPIGWRYGMAVGRAEFVARIHDWQAALATQAGQSFALYLDDSIEFAAALLGLWYAGKTVRLCADIQPASIAALRGSVDGFVGSFPADCVPLQIGDVRTAAGDPTVTPALLSGERLALFVHTSGSTGQAQAIPKKLSQLDSEVAVLEQLFGAALGEASILSTVSHHHIYGLLFKVLWPLAAGRAIHAGTIRYPEELANYPMRSVLISSPAHLKRLPDQVSWNNGAAIFCSGGVLSAEAAMHCKQVLDHVPIEVYGSSESGGIAWRQRADAHDDAWHPMPNLAWRSVDGQIAVRSPHCIDDQWLLMADRIEAVGHDRFRLIGRADRIVKIEEKRVSLDALEQCLVKSGWVTDARLLVIEKDGTHEQLAAVVTLGDRGTNYLRMHGKLAMNRQLRAVLHEVAVVVALPRRWRYVDQLPVNEQGKTTLALLQALFLERPDESEPEHPPQASLLYAPDYRLERQWTDDVGLHAQLEVRWPANLIYFQGHFPVAPVLPGVVQVDWAIRLAIETFQLSGRFGGMRVLKFQQVVRPDDVTRLVLRFDEHKRTLNFSFDGPDKQYSSGRIVLSDGAMHD